jgi:hypothetical protein
VSNRTRSKGDYTDQHVGSRTRSKTHNVDNLIDQYLFFPLQDGIKLQGHGKSEELGSSISDNHFILHILNNMMEDYDLQLAMMKRVTDKSNPLFIDEIRDDLNLRFERSNEKQNKESENDNNQEVAFFGGQFKGKC